MATQFTDINKYFYVTKCVRRPPSLHIIVMSTKRFLWFGFHHLCQSIFIWSTLLDNIRNIKPINSCFAPFFPLLLWQWHKRSVDSCHYILSIVNNKITVVKCVCLYSLFSYRTQTHACTELQMDDSFWCVVNIWSII